MNDIADILLDFDIEKSFAEEIVEQQIQINLAWVTRNGSKKSLQYWVYCESSHDNFLKVDLQVPGFDVTSRSRIMQDTYRNLYFVEENNLNTCYRTVFPLFSSFPVPSLMPSSLLYPVDCEKFTLKMNLIADDEFPKHPFQEDAKYVQSKTEILSSHLQNVLFPFSSTVRVNFQGRAEGWFKIQTFLMYEETMVIAQSITEPFMFNNPRLKKMKDHKQYSEKEIKFMILAELSDNKEKFRELYGYLHANKEELLEKSSSLFPNVKKCSKSKKINCKFQ